jgi:hypothetical protein
VGGGVEVDPEPEEPVEVQQKRTVPAHEQPLLDLINFRISFQCEVSEVVGTLGTTLPC